MAMTSAVSETKKAAAPKTEIGYAQAPTYQWWLDQDETTPELVWPQSIWVYDAMRRTDSQVTSVLRAMTLPVRRTPWRIDPNGAKDEVVEFVADNLGLPVVGEELRVPTRQKDRFSWPEHLRQALLMLPFGHSYFEQTYRVDKGGKRALLRKLGPRMPKTIERIEVAEDGGLVSIQQYWTRLEQRPRPIPVNRLVAYVHEREGGNWLGSSILRPAYKNWLLKDRLLRVWAQTIERNGMGIPLYKGPEDATDLSTGLAMAKAWRAGEAAGSAVPFGADLTLVGVSGTLPDADPAVRYHDEQIGRAVLAHFLNLGTQTGSWALGTTFADFFTLSLQTLAMQIADTATCHIVEDLVDVNWGEDEPAPKVVFDEIGSRQQATAQSLVSLFGAGALTPDARLEESLRQQYGLPPLDPATARGENAINIPGSPAAEEAAAAPPEAPAQGAVPPPPTDTEWVAASAEPDGDAFIVAALIQALVEVTGRVHAKAGPDFEHLHPRGPGGKFRDVVDKIVNALGAWSRGLGPNDPMPEDKFTREHLRAAAIHIGIKPKPGASRADIHDLILNDVRESTHTQRQVEKPSAKFTLQHPPHAGKDVTVRRQANGDAVGLFETTDAGTVARNPLERFDSIHDLHAWAEEHDESRLAKWAGGEAEGRPRPKAPEKSREGRPSSMAEVRRELEGLSQSEKKEKIRGWDLTADEAEELTGTPRPAKAEPRRIPDRLEGDEAALFDFSQKIDAALTPAQKTQLRGARLSDSTKRSYYQHRKDGKTHATSLRLAKAEQAKLRQEFERDNPSPDSAKTPVKRAPAKKAAKAPAKAPAKAAPVSPREGGGALPEGVPEGSRKVTTKDVPAGHTLYQHPPTAGGGEAFSVVNADGKRALLIKPMRAFRQRPDGSEDRSRTAKRWLAIVPGRPDLKSGELSTRGLAIEAGLGLRDAPTMPRLAPEPNLQSRLDAYAQQDLTKIAFAVDVDPRHALKSPSGPTMSATEFAPSDSPYPFGSRLRTRAELAREIDKAAQADPEVRAKVLAELDKLPPPAPRPKRAPAKAGAVRQGRYDIAGVPARAGTTDAPIRWAPGAEPPGWTPERARSARAALRAYGNASFEINESLRGRPVAEPVFAPAVTRRHIDVLDDLMDASHTTEPMEQWRGIHSAVDLFGGDLDGDLTGREWTEDAFVSTSSREDVSKWFGTYGQGGMLMRLSVPAGVGAAQVKDVRGEAEALLQRGLRMRIVADYGRQPGLGYRLVDVEVIPGEPKPLPPVSFSGPVSSPNGPDVPGSPARSLGESIATGVADTKKLPQGRTSATQIDTFADGQRAVRKRALGDWNGLTPKDQADSEELTAVVGAAIGAPVPPVHRLSDDTVYVGFANGTRGDEAGYAPYQLPTGNADDVRRLGLLDLLTVNNDRFADNYMVDDSGRVTGFDHSLSWSPTATTADPGDAPFQAGTFGQAFIQSGGIFGNPTFKQGPFTAEELTDLRAKLVPLRSEFDRLGHRDWYDYSLGRMDALIKAAGGSPSSPRVDTPAPGLVSIDETARPADLDTRIRDAYAELASESGDWVSLARLRTKLGDVSDGDFDRAVKALYDSPDINLEPDANQSQLTTAQRRAAVRIGGEDRHILQIDSRQPHRQTTAAPAPTAARRDVPGLSNDPAVREVQLHNRIKAAYAELAVEPGAWVSLSRLRTRFDDVPPDELDRALKSLYSGSRGVNLEPDANQSQLGAAERKASVRIGGEDRHIIQITDTRPSPAEAQAVTRQARIDSARTVADTLSEIAQLQDSGASPEALVSRINGRRGRGLPDAEADRLIAAVRGGDVDSVRDDLAREHNLTPIGAPGSVSPFNPASMTMVGGGRPPTEGSGQQVRVVRPGYTAMIDGERVQLSKAVVEVDGPAPAKATPVKVAKKAAPGRRSSAAGGPVRLHTKEGLDETFGYHDAQTGLTATVESFSGRDPDMSSYARIVVKDRNGKTVGGGTRTIHRADSKSVSHAGFSLDRGVQGQGFMTRYNQHVEDSYRRNGIERIELHASGGLADGNQAVGSYAWARQGYEFTPESRDRVARDAKAYAARTTNLSPAMRAEILRVANDPTATPADFAMIGHESGAKTWPGKEILLTSGWDGVKTLTPTARKSPSPAVAKAARAKAAAKPKIDIPAIAAALRGGGGNVEVITVLASEPDLTSARLRELATELGIDVPENVKAKSALQLFLGEEVPRRFGAGDGQLANRAPARVGVAFNPADVAERIQLPDQGRRPAPPASEIMSVLDGVTTLSRLRQVADEMNMAIPDRRFTGQQLREFMVEQIIRDWGRWSWR